MAPDHRNEISCNVLTRRNLLRTGTLTLVAGIGISSAGLSAAQPEEDIEDGSETHTLTVIVTDTEGQRVEGAEVGVVTYDAGEDVGQGTTDECGEVQFEVVDGSYEISARYEGLAQSSANRLVAVNGGDATLVINLFDPSEEDGPESGDIVEPEPCKTGEGKEPKEFPGSKTGEENSKKGRKNAASNGKGAPPGSGD